VIAVTGTGRVTGPPDLVRARVTATAARPTAAEALAATEAVAAAVRAALDLHGISRLEAASGIFSLAVDQIWEQGGPRVTGYRCDHGIRVTVRDVPAVGQVLADLLAAGGDGVRVDGVEPDIDDVTPLRVRARELAWADALDRATRLAELAGRGLGAVRQIVEDAAPGLPRPITRQAVGSVALAAVSGNAPVGLQPGAVEVAVTLDVQWEIA
jgi:uncharacterized protein